MLEIIAYSIQKIAESGGKNIEIAVFYRGKELQILDDEEVERISKAIEAEKPSEESRKSS